jgi:hypothetical protein
VRILGKVVIGSITDNFYTTLQNYAGDNLASNGPLVLWLILTHFHASTITYQEKIKQGIWTRWIESDHKTTSSPIWNGFATNSSSCAPRTLPQKILN